MEKHYIDLEGTVIDSWQSPTPVNLHLREFLEGKEVIIYSFALLNREDSNHFFVNVKDTLQTVFGCTVTGIVFTETICDEFAKEDGVEYEDYLDRVMYRNELGKEGSFLRYVKKYGNSDVVYHLWDDTVEDKEIGNVRFHRV